MTSRIHMPAQAEEVAKLSPCDVAALERCLKDNKGDHKKVRLGGAAEARSSLCSMRLPLAPTDWRDCHVGQAILPPFMQCLEEVQAFQRVCSKPKQQPASK